MKIGGLQKVTLVDYPGKIACTIFLSGCNFRCPFCYSRELVLTEEIEKHPQLSHDYLFAFLKDKIGLLDGCVICGGEPTIYGDELIELAKKIKEMDFLVKLDTNGSNPEVVKKLIDLKLVDYIAMDIKAPLEAERYAGATGVGIDIAKIKESIDIIKGSGVDYEFRSTIVPIMHSEEDIVKMAEMIAPAKKYFLQQFRGEKGTIDPSFSGMMAYPDEFMEMIKDRIGKLFGIFKVR